jgi:hypothetical protein
MNIYGIINKDNTLIDVSRNKKATKRYATIHGYTKIGCRFNGGYNATIIAEKIDGKWVDV